MNTNKSRAKYSVVDNDEIEKIHLAGMKLLEKIGIKIESDIICKLFQKKGAIVDYDNHIVKLPKSIIAEQLGLVPKVVRIYGRKPQHTITVRGNGENVYFGTGGAVTNILDIDSGECRKPLFQDLANLARLVDSLENIHLFLRPLEGASDLNGEELDVLKAYTSLSNTYKPVMLGVWTAPGVRKIVEMASLIAGGLDSLRQRPFISFISTPIISPLKFDMTQLPIIETIVKNRIPLAIGADPISGLTAPATLAGTISLAHAESVFCLVLTQILSEKAPVLYLPLTSTFDMTTMGYLEGAVECGIMMATCVKLANFLDLPMVSDAGCTDSKLPDAQAGYEKAANIFQVALAGGSLIHHSAGMLDSMNTVAYEQYVIDNDINGMVLRALQGVVINEDTLAFDTISSVGPGGQFISELHTVKYYRSSEFFYPKVAVRTNRSEWENSGGFDARERSRLLAKRILEEHHPKPLSEDTDMKLRNQFGISL